MLTVDELKMMPNFMWDTACRCNFLYFVFFASILNELWGRRRQMLAFAITKHRSSPCIIILSAQLYRLRDDFYISCSCQSPLIIRILCWAFFSFNFRSCAVLLIVFVYVKIEWSRWMKMCATLRIAWQIEQMCLRKIKNEKLTET